MAQKITQIFGDYAKGRKDDFLKSMLLCSEALPVGERGWYWLKSTCATLAGFKVNGKGLDKIHPDERVKWVDGNIQFICEIANNPEEYVENWGNADKPFQFLACCREIAKAVEFGNPHEYVCGFPIQFDGSCSGIQHYSAMFLDENGGKMVNLSDDKEMADVYRAVAEILDSRKQKSGIAPNLIHSQDATHLRMAILACAKRGVRHFVMIHDSFGTIPAHAQIMYEESSVLFVI
ncbi:uncharacterized protein LOC143278198 [Babylonia areolata]|uniref:uncharacterized protein LOC143278198 n=1 Tax=Babylonia areolata TaxID=304850 RepID=UPI003FD2CB1F